MKREYENRKSKSTSLTACSKAGALRLSRRRQEPTPNKGNVSLQAVNQLVEKGKTVYVITISTPAYNDVTVFVSERDKLQNCEFIDNISRTIISPEGEIKTSKMDEYKNPENPTDIKLKQHLHLWNKEDGVAGGLAGGDYYKSNGITENIEIPTVEEYNNRYWEPNPLKWEFVNAHGFDANRPQLIYQMFLNKKINPIK